MPALRHRVTRERRWRRRRYLSYGNIAKYTKFFVKIVVCRRCGSAAGGVVVAAVAEISKFPPPIKPAYICVVRIVSIIPRVSNRNLFTIKSCTPTFDDNVRRTCTRAVCVHNGRFYRITLPGGVASDIARL